MSIVYLPFNFSFIFTCYCDVAIYTLHLTCAVCVILQRRFTSEWSIHLQSNPWMPKPSSTMCASPGVVSSRLRITIMKVGFKLSAHYPLSQAHISAWLHIQVAWTARPTKEGCIGQWGLEWGCGSVQLAGWKKHDVLANCHWIREREALCCHDRLIFFFFGRVSFCSFRGKKTQRSEGLSGLLKQTYALRACCDLDNTDGPGPGITACVPEEEWGWTRERENLTSKFILKANIPSAPRERKRIEMDRENMWLQQGWKQGHAGMKRFG